eukprot:355648-Pyramimonas_sp.AAC.2
MSSTYCAPQARTGLHTHPVGGTLHQYRGRVRGRSGKIQQIQQIQGHGGRGRWALVRRPSTRLAATGADTARTPGWVVFLRLVRLASWTARR